jgi:hypothetical protein
VVSEFLHNYIYDRLRTQSQVRSLALEFLSERFCKTFVCETILWCCCNCVRQLGYIVQAWCSRKHGIGRIRVPPSRSLSYSAACLSQSLQVLVQSQLDEKHVESEMLKASPRFIVCIVCTAYIVQAMEGFIEHFDSISDESIRQFLVSFAEQELQPDLNVRKAADRVAFQAFANHR